MLLQQLYVLLSLVHVRVHVALGHLGALPDVHWDVRVALHDEDGTWVKDLVALL